MYVETILEVHHKYNALVLTAFNNDAGFVAALDKVLYNTIIFTSYFNTDLVLCLPAVSGIWPAFGHQPCIFID